MAIQYPLTPQAKIAAQNLATAWEDGVLPQTMLFGSYLQGKISIPMFFDLNGNQLNYDDAPQRGEMFELAQYNLIKLRQFGEGTTLEVILLQELLNAVHSDFVASEWFLALNAPLMLQQAAPPSLPAATHHTINGDSTNDDKLINTIPHTHSDLATALRDTLPSDFYGRRDIAPALNDIAAGRNLSLSITAILRAMGQVMKDAQDSHTAGRAVCLIAAYLGSDD